MNPVAFAYWLQGLFELAPDIKTLDEKQTACIRRHLALVFKHIDTPDPTGELQQIHDGKLKPTVKPTADHDPHGPHWGGPTYRC